MTRHVLLSTTRFQRYQWQVLFATMFCYLFFYTGRQTFGFAIPGIEAELGVSKASLGWVSAGLLWAYAIGQFINGNLGDQFGGRRMMATGAWLSCLLNWVASFGQSLLGIGVPWIANGFAQSMGWAPGSRVLANWWPANRRGMVYGCYLFAAGLSSVLAYATSTLILQYELGWRWIFRIPVLLMLVGGTVYYICVRDRPEDLGFTAMDDDSPSRISSDSSSTKGTLESNAPFQGQSQTIVDRYRLVLANRPFLIASLAIGFQSTARYGLLIWVPVHFLGTDWKESPNQWISLALPLGMALGALVSGWVSDVLFAGNRPAVIGLSLTAAAVCSAVMAGLDRGSSFGIIALFLTGFFAYGPQSAFWALCPDLLGRKLAGTGTGVMNAFAYAVAGLGEPFIGWSIDRQQDTSVVFTIVAICCLLGAVLSQAIRTPSTQATD